MSANEVIINAFIDESKELLEELEGLLLDLEADPSNREKLDAVFRVMHTIKGSAGMVGYETINQFTHQVEDSFDLIRQGQKAFDGGTADATLLARDIITTLLETKDQSNEKLDAQMQSVVALLGAGVAEAQAAAEEQQEVQGPRTYQLTFIPGEDIFLRGLNPLNILSELLLAGECTITTQFDRLPEFSQINPEKSYLYWDILLSTEKPLSEIREVFLFVESESQIDIKEITPENDDDPHRLGDILKHQGAINDEELQEALDGQKKLGEVLVEQEKVSEDQLHKALKEQEHFKKQELKTSKAAPSSSIRVSTEKLDSFVDLVGELVTLQAQLDQTVGRIADMELGSVSERLQTLIEDLRDTALGIRMIPIGDSFSSFRRLVRDLSNQLGKSIRLETVGGETELDKTVIDRLHDPLMHLIRNSIDHGIESPAERSAAGKDQEGTIRLSAEHRGGNVLITIEDDGGGLSRDKILEKAIARGLTTADAKLRDEDIYKMIFFSGFSTAQKISKVSGRGVGMDVVKREIDALGGHISVDSKEGEFTRISFTLPLTLAIIDGLLVQVAGDHFVLPLSAVESCLEMDEVQKDGQAQGEGDIIYYRENFLPYIKMREFLEYRDEAPEREQIVVIRTEDSFYGLVVDQVIGDHQTVIKNLGKLFHRAREYSGATILGNGDVALILNISTLAQLSRQKQEV